MDTPVRNEPLPSAGAFFESFDGWAQLLKAHALCATDSAGAPRPAEDAGVAEALPLGEPEAAEAFLDRHHARLDRLPGGSWLLTDLGSTDGTWVRVMTAKLRPGTHLQIGGTRLVFRRDADGTSAFAPVGQGAAADSAPSFPCPPTPVLLGRADAQQVHADPGLPTLLLDDPFVSPVHAEVVAGRGAWRIVNRGLNGLWVRIEAPVRLHAVAQFQCGDQRFVLEPLTADS